MVITRLIIFLLVLVLAPIHAFPGTPSGGIVAGGVEAGPLYSLRDDFRTDLAAGSLNGTAAEPGPGSRTIVDSLGTKASISGGWLRLLGKSTGDPGYWLGPAKPRALGQLAVYRVRPSYDSLYFGLSTANSGALTDNGFLISRTGTIGEIKENNAAQYLSPITFNEAYDVSQLLQATGDLSFIRGGNEYPYHELIWRSKVKNGANLYAGILSGNSVSTSIDANYAKLPLFKYTNIAPIISDSFNRADAALGSTDGVGDSIFSGGSGYSWTDQQGSYGVATNKAQPSALDGGGIAVTTISVLTTDIYIDRLVLTRAAGVVGVVLRYVDADNHIRVVHDGTNIALIKRVAGTETTVTTSALAFGAGNLTVTSSGPFFHVWWNDVSISNRNWIGDAKLQKSTKIGFYSTDLGNTFDRFVVFAKGTSGEYGLLGRFHGSNYLATTTNYIVAADGSGNFTTNGAAINAVTAPTILNRFHIYVKNGTYHELQLTAPNWTTIEGESKDGVVIVADGTRTDIAPAYTWKASSDYGAGQKVIPTVPNGYEYQNQANNATPLTTGAAEPAWVGATVADGTVTWTRVAIGGGKTYADFNVLYKHGFWSTYNTIMKNLTIQANDVKYCIHIDGGTTYTARYNNCHFKMDTTSNHIIGIGSYVNQRNIFTDCTFEGVSGTSGYGVFWHNALTQSGPTWLELVNPNFINCLPVELSEIGSNYSDLVTIINPTTDDPTYGVNLITADGALPYCINLVVIGGNFPTLGFSAVDRPNALDHYYQQ